MKKLFIAIATCSVAFLVQVTPSYAMIGEQITQFDSRIQVSRDNKVLVTETIVYDYSRYSRHGIYRDIPIDYHDGNDTYHINFKLEHVTDEFGIPVQTEISTENGNKRIRIGDPDVTVTNVHTYKIQYVLYPVVTEKDGKAFLNLDVIGEGWQVPIDNITATVILEDGLSLSNISWLGANESKNPSELSVSHVAAYSGVTLNATLPDGYISQFLRPNTLRTEDIISMLIWILIGVIGVVAILFAIIVILIRTIRTRKKREKQIVVAQYEPPVGLSPAHLGLLEDDISSNREITATIINWAVLGYIKIVFIPRKGLFQPQNYQLIKYKEPIGLHVSEIPLFNAFFSRGSEVLLSQIDKSLVASAVRTFNTAVKADLSNLGYYEKEGQLLMRGTLTEEGAKQWALVDGFRLYLSVVEKDRLTFTDAPDKTPERFSKLLPYAIALGVEKEWAKQFEGIDLSQETTWYSGNLATFSAVALASDLGNSFASTVSSNTLVDSDGGSVGGGFGGGGGGSW